MPFTHEIRVRYGECDAQGVAFNAHYLAWFDVAITELWRERLGGYAELLATGVDSVVAEATVRYLKPIRFDDVIELEVSVSRIGNTSLVIGQRVLRGGELCAEGELRYVFIEVAGGTPTPIPDAVRAALAEV